MKKFLKRILATTLTVVAILSGIPLTKNTVLSLTELFSASPGDGYYYDLNTLPSKMPQYPKSGQKYWVIFNEGYRDNRLEMSTFDVSGDSSDIKLIWNDSLKVSSSGTISDINQYAYTEKEWVNIGCYHILSDKATKIFASNADVYDNNGKKIISASKWNGADNDNFEDTNSTVEPDGMRVIINNTNLSYQINDDILVAVSEFNDNIESYPKKISVKTSDDTMLSVLGTYDYSTLPKNITVPDGMEKCRFIHLKANQAGVASVSITNSETGETRTVPINISEDQYATLRIDKVPVIEYNLLNAKDTYNGYSNGIWISDLSYESTYGGWNVSMNLYNENYCCGVVEVYDKTGKITEIRDVEKFESLTQGIVKTFKAGYTIIKDAFDKKTFSFRSKASAKETKIKNLIIPQDGFIRVTADCSVSKYCALNNGFDLMFTSWSLADDLKEIVNGISSLSHDNIEAIKGKLFLKLVLQDEYLNFGEEFQEKIIDSCSQPLTVNMFNLFSSQIALDCEQLLEDMGLTMDELLKTALDTGINIAEGFFEKCAGISGFALKAMFTFQDIVDFYCEVDDLRDNQTGEAPFGFCTPLGNTVPDKLKFEKVTVIPDNNIPPETILESYQIINGDKVVINADNIGPISEYELYEIALVNNGKKIQPEGYVKVYIDSPYDYPIVAKQSNDGSWKIIESKVENDMVVFEVDHFCKFAVSEKKPENNDSVSDSDTAVNNDSSKKVSLTVMIALIIIAVVSIGVIVFIIIKKKKKHIK